VTVLFVDIVGSTRLVSTLDPEDARIGLDAVMARLRPVIEGQGGTIAKTMGDGLFAIFGAPLALENHAYLACHAAVQLQGLAPELRIAEVHPVRLRVGLNTGIAVIHSQGEGAELRVDAIGDVVNRAAHLEARASPGSILIGTETRRLGGRGVQSREAPAAQGGKGADQQAWELLGCLAPTSPILMDAVDFNTPFIGRRRERAFINASISELAEGRGDVMTLVGEAGSGKTRLLAECLGSLDPEATRVVAVAGAVTDRSSPHALLRRVLAALLDIDDASVGQVSALRKALGVLSPMLEMGATALAWMLHQDGPETPKTLSMHDAERQRSLALGSMRTVLTTLASQKPLVLALDDYQWSDPSSRRFFEEAAALTGNTALLLLFATRDERETLAGLSRQVLRLPPLSRAEMLDLLDGSTGLEAVPEALRERILERCEGNPRFLVEIARNLLDASETTTTEGDKIAEDFPVPDSVADLFEERIDRLEESDRRALQVAAAFEGALDRRVLAALLEAGEEEARTSLRHLHMAGLIRQVEHGEHERFLVGNPVVAKAAYRSLLRDERQLLHGRICDLLPTLEDMPLRSRALARHAYRCGRHALSAQSFYAAGRHALSRLSYAEGVELLRSGLRATERCREVTDDLLRLSVDMRIELRNGLFPASAFEDIDTVLAPALATAQTLGDDARARAVRRLQVANLMALGRLDAALPQARELVQHEPADSPGRDESRLMLAQVLASLGHYQEALTEFQGLLDSLGSPTDDAAEGPQALTRALSCMWALWCASEVGCFEQMTSRVLQAQADLDPDLPPLFRVLAGVGTGLFWLRFGEVELAADTLLKALPLTESESMGAWFPAVASPYGLALVRLGRAAEARTYLQAAVDRTPYRGGVGRGQRLAHLALCHLALGERKLAEQVAREAVEISRRTRESGVLAHALHTLSEVLAGADITGAAAAREEATALARAHHMGSLLRELGG
jgi:class 3 adenylate cyclase/tetratricopeptide (TPR) repeat protein